MNDFARKQLEKFGWTDGKGLGKKENGITKPIRAVLKLDTHGVGHDRVNVLASRWWCDAFNEASKRITVVNSEEGVSLSNAKPNVDPVLPSPARLRKKFVKVNKADYSKDPQEITEESIDISCSSPSTNLSADALYQKCDGVKEYHKKSIKAKHKRIKRQDAIYYAQKVKSKDQKTRNKIKT